ncbi:MAG: putative transporter small subunit [Porticoccaceae bacterium]|nr:putative transporter small subunit [Porticoccaceae bacterium]
MTTAWVLATYILIWPFISLIVLAVIIGATVRDTRKARREGRDVV